MTASLHAACNRLRAVLCALLCCVALVASPAAAQEPVLPAAPDSVVVPAPLTGVLSVSLGTDHACAVVSGGKVYCWGRNHRGQLGVPTPASSSVPIEVPGLANIRAVAAGNAHTCALGEGSRPIFCWGDSALGQWGDLGSPSQAGRPPLNDVRAISAGGDHNCALAGGTINSGSPVLCWGRNDQGQLGAGVVSAPSNGPVTVVGLPSMTGIAAGLGHTCSLRGTFNGDRLVRCWGQNDAGQAGVDPAVTTVVSSFVTLTGLGPAISIAAGSFHTCALLPGGRPRCWGSNTAGQLGNGATGDSSATPVVVGELDSGGITAMAPGLLHTCALSADGALFCWGRNIRGELGDGTLTSRTRIGLVSGLESGVLAVDAGPGYTCAIHGPARTLYCWGENAFGRLGNGTSLDRNLPTAVRAPQTCFALALAHAGSGGTPAATPSGSDTCPAGHYLPGQRVDLLASPAAGQRVREWANASAGGAGDTDAVRIMPAADVTVTVTYEPCFALTRTRSGAGSVPQAAPDRSAGCAAGQYASGESITLAAVPDAGQRVQAWAGAAAAPAAGSQVNTLAMPAGARTVSVAYEACFALSAGKVGEGSLPQPTPQATFGCLTGGFASGETVAVQAQPAAGWAVAGWLGTQNDASTATTNSVAVVGAQSVTVIYERTGAPGDEPVIWLPLVGGR